MELIIKPLAEVDEMTKYRDAAMQMGIDTCVDCTGAESEMLAKAITDLYGPRTVKSVALGMDLWRVIRTEQRPKRTRRPKAPPVVG